MTGDELSPALRALVNDHITTMDHVALLLALKREEECHTVELLARAERLEVPVVERVLVELLKSRLVTARVGGGYRYDPPVQLRPLVDELLEMYQRRPVTLVRAIYDRPARTVQSFADAFRIRQSDS